VTTDELGCQEFVELVTDYLEGGLAEPDRRRFEEHLAVCPGCTAYLEQMRETIRLTGTLREADVAPEALAALLGAFRDWKARPA
jgi:anti-sigma factor RsiW